MKKRLVVYYSWSNGNTKKIAEELAKEAGADLLRIEPEVPYSGSYEEVVDQGKKETEAGYMPELKKLSVNPDEYEVIAAGTPTWWYTMAPAMHTFLHEQNWKGKTFIPFMTNAGWPGTVIRDMEKEAEGAEIRLPKEIRFDSEGGDHMVTSSEELEDWIRSVSESVK